MTMRSRSGFGSGVADGFFLCSAPLAVRDRYLGQLIMAAGQAVHHRDRRTIVDVQQVLTNLWELHDGTTACVVMPRLEPGWELWLMRDGRLLDRQSCRSTPELIAKSTELHRLVTS
jgi:hypothetical protein